MPAFIFISQMHNRIGYANQVTNTIPRLETSRLVLRALRADDASALYQHINDWDIIRYLNKAMPYPYTMDDANRFIAERLDPDDDSLVWALTHKERGDKTDELIGCITLWPNNPASNRGFWLGKAFHANGLMTEAVKAVNDFAFNVLGMTALRLNNAVTNDASRRVKEKTGAVFVGEVAKQYRDPELTRAETWILTADAWRAYRDQKPD